MNIREGGQNLPPPAGRGLSLCIFHACIFLLFFFFHAEHRAHWCTRNAYSTNHKPSNQSPGSCCASAPNVQCVEFVQCVEKSAYIFPLIVFAHTLDVSKYHAFEWSGICVICVRIPDRVTVFIGVFCLPARINTFKMLNVCVCVKHSQSPETPHSSVHSSNCDSFERQFEPCLCRYILHCRFSHQSPGNTKHKIAYWKVDLKAFHLGTKE